jgi:hypothetical protein
MLHPKLVKFNIAGWLVAFLDHLPHPSLQHSIQCCLVLVSVLVCLSHNCIMDYF